jgi:hypothetical protein
MHGLHCSFAYSAFACFRMGMSGSASFQSVGKPVLASRLMFPVLQQNHVCSLFLMLDR